MASFRAKGYLYFKLGSDGLYFYTESAEDVAKRCFSETNSYIVDFVSTTICFSDCSFIEGKQFLNDVRNGCLTDYDGCIEHVFVDGYVSNLGLVLAGLRGSERFLVDADVWLELCDEHQILVDWSNK